MSPKTTYLCMFALAAGCAGCRMSPEANEARFLRRGQALMAQKDYSRAILEFRNAATVRPRDAEAYYQLGLLLHKRGEKEKGDEALARFKALRDTEYSDRAVILKQLQDTLR